MDALHLHAVVNQTAPCSPAETVLLNAELWYPAVLLLAFISSAATYSILTSRSEEELVEPTATGPDGKPLPVTKRKREDIRRLVVEAHIGTAARRVFQYLSAAVVLTFLADFVTVIVHVFHPDKSGTASGWWCGEERIVSFACPPAACPPAHGVARPGLVPAYKVFSYFRFTLRAHSSSTSTS